MSISLRKGQFSGCYSIWYNSQLAQMLQPVMSRCGRSDTSTETLDLGSIVSFRGLQTPGVLYIIELRRSGLIGGETA